MSRDAVRAVLMAAVMVGAYFLALAITPRDYMADSHPRVKLAQIVPAQFGDWTVDSSVVPIAPSPDLQKVLDETYDETLALTYRNPSGTRVMLSLAYGRNQHKGMNTHRPEICYPAQGFKIVSDPRRDYTQVGNLSLPVTRLVTALGARTEVITYWLLVGDSITYFGRPQRASTISYGLNGIIPDGVLVRVSTIGRDAPAEFAVQDQFVRDLLSAVPKEQLPRLIGALGNPV